MNKFRVYDKESKEIYYDYFVIDNDGVLYNVTFVNSQITKCSQDDFIIMYSSNKKDINGTEIYERDILRFPSGKEYVVVGHDLLCSEDKSDVINWKSVAVLLDEGKLDYCDVYLLSEGMEASVVGTYISNEEKYMIPYSYGDGFWYCPECGELIGSCFIINAPENDIREEWSHCECCEAPFDIARWEMMIDELNGDEDDEVL